MAQPSARAQFSMQAKFRGSTQDVLNLFDMALQLGLGAEMEASSRHALSSVMVTVDHHDGLGLKQALGLMRQLVTEAESIGFDLDSPV